MVLRHYTWAHNAARVLDWLAPGSRRGKDTAATKAHNAARALDWFAPTPAPPQVGSMMPTPTPLPILDARLRQRLYRATRPDLAAQLLGRRWPDDSYRLEGIETITLLKYKPNRRCVLMYDLLGQDCHTGRPARRQVIGKVFRDERGARLFNLQTLLYQHGFGPAAADEIHVPEALAYVPEMRMLVQAYAPGQTLSTLSLQGNIGWAVQRAAEGLAKLHRSPAFAASPDNSRPRLKPYTLADELRGVDDYTARLAETRPGDMPVIESLQATLLTWADSLPAAATTVPLHRDFYYSQVLFHGSRLHLIDFDLLALGDPAVDVANFIAHLAYLGLEQFGDLGWFAREMGEFLATYTATLTTDATFARRVVFYQASTFFRLLNVIAPRPAVQHLFPSLLAHTRHQLCSLLGVEPDVPMLTGR